MMMSFGNLQYYVYQENEPYKFEEYNYEGYSEEAIDHFMKHYYKRWST